VNRSAKYRHVCEEAIRAIGARELAKGRTLREAVKATKGRLHQVGAAYLAGRPPYSEWLQELRETSGGEPDRLRALCRQAMAHHSSTRERLTVLDTLFVKALGPLAPVRSVLDVACGLNPLAIPWMPLAPDAQYYGCDIYTDMVAFLNAALPMLGVRGRIESRDVTLSPPEVEVQVALILKSLPCLEQLAPSSSARLLREMRANVLLVSYPVRSLGGREKGMAHNYERQFWELVEGQAWAVRRLAFQSELVFVVTKNPPQ
jgi:16S rRNA (guanine(1405)-N(7))-methyltransferase